MSHDVGAGNALVNTAVERTKDCQRVVQRGPGGAIVKKTMNVVAAVIVTSHDVAAGNILRKRAVDAERIVQRRPGGAIVKKTMNVVIGIREISHDVGAGNAVGKSADTGAECGQWRI